MAWALTFYFALFCFIYFFCSFIKLYLRHNIHPIYSKYTVWHSLTYNEIIIVIKMISTSIKSLSYVTFPEEHIAVGGVCSGDNLGMVLSSRHILRNSHFSFCHPFYFFRWGLSQMVKKWGPSSSGSVSQAEVSDQPLAVDSGHVVQGSEHGFEAWGLAFSNLLCSVVVIDQLVFLSQFAWRLRWQ